jgi:hypothetical protein
MRNSGLLKLALVLGSAYAVYWIITRALPQLGVAVAGKLSEVGESIGGGLYEWLHPNASGTMVYYTITFPNGSRHALPSDSIGSDGRFDYIAPPLAATHWRVVVDANGNKFAQAVS